ncbi:MAG: lysine--tRNA ligase [Candidatus Gracilibacteria bacterium]|nr:lysine--tRNA ligase [Candidatus Gracilibacteria bacterium]
MEYSREAIDRQKKIQDMKNAGIICYANNYNGKQDISKIIEINSEKYKDVEYLMENGAIGEFKTAGRIISSRGMGKLVFGKIRDFSGDIQISFMRDKVIFNTGKELVENIIIEGEEKSAFKIAEKFCQVGDYIGVIGDLFLTKHGELTLFVKEFQVLSKAVRPLPEKFHGLSDEETIYRQRYLQLITDDEAYDRFLFRSKFVKSLRDFYDKNNFIEIETPVLGNSASGARAKPFTTFHNDFEEDFYLRIAPEVNLKKATVGRFERVFEIGKQFRNEGSDPSHMQEYTSVEHYAAWWNFEDNMRFTKEMFDYIFSDLKLNPKVNITDRNGIVKEVDFSREWEKIDYIEGVKDVTGIDVSTYNSGDEAILKKDIEKAGVKIEGIEKMGLTTMIDYLYKKALRPSIVGPAFVYNYPKNMQPLARVNDENPKIVEQFQLVINGWEILKAYSELVDPVEQQSNFDAQAKYLAQGDEEATAPDNDFVLAMEYGMPPQSGWGMGVDRIIALITGQQNLRDTVLFPLMKSKKENIGE